MVFISSDIEQSDNATVLEMPNAKRCREKMTNKSLSVAAAK
jgi:hypothetical protein